MSKHEPMLKHVPFVPAKVVALVLLRWFCDLPKFQKRLIAVPDDAHRCPVRYLLTDCFGKAMSVILLTNSTDIGKGKEK